MHPELAIVDFSCGERSLASRFEVVMLRSFGDDNIFRFGFGLGRQDSSFCFFGAVLVFCICHLSPKPSSYRGELRVQVGFC